ncbi:hypothetical protein [Paenibacillus sp. OK003]|uniref:hypothetical protein n=1 Tax=Paenibacillus sp. OK003 TaxID=1884380 RepID=UPI0008CB405C|nr:hypothetical protein [Paenibacillus sp. OK003]SEL28924.1 hypothetical protein SAMN05518856_109157 [Paenibacillus sp. OK003]
MKYLKSGFNAPLVKNLNVLLLNDSHIGPEAADIRLLDRAIDFAKTNEHNIRNLLNGDYIEGVIKLGKGGIYIQYMYPREPIYFVMDKLEPVKPLNVTYCRHWHKEFSKPIKRSAIDTYNGLLVREEKPWLVCRNTIVNTAEYAERDGFEESFPSQAHLTLSGKKSNKGIDVKWIS